MSWKDAKTMSEECSQFARELADWGEGHPIKDPEIQQQLDDTVEALVKSADDLMDRAMSEALKDLSVSVEGLQDAVKQARHSLAVISDVTKVLTVAAASVNMAAAIMHPTPAGVSMALNNLITATKNAVTVTV